ncbi:MAG: PAS domain-containing sensor histidine kinase [Prolixibacteraceae bacterium]
MTVRNLNTSISFLIVFVQCAWLMLRRVPPEKRELTFSVGIVSMAYVFVTLLRIIYFLIHHPSEINYLNSNAAESLFVLSYQMLFLLLTFTLVLMFNKRLLMEIESHEEKFSKAFYHSPNAYILSRFPDGQIFEVNEGFCKISGYDISEIMGKTIYNLILYGKEEDLLSVNHEISSSGKILGRELQFRKKSGQIITGLFSAEIITVNNEKCIISVINDITERKLTEEILKESESSLRKLNATKDKLFSIIAHDLRNPFFFMIGYSEVLKKQVKELDSNTIEKYAGIINSAAVKTFGLVENLLDWAKIQQGKMFFNPSDIGLKKMVDDVFNLLKENADNKEIEFFNHIPDHMLVFADQNMLKTILRNLISNGLKFTNNNGFIDIGTIENENEIRIIVKDNGIGIKPENISQLFQATSNQTTRGTENEKGTGLGLILCHEFVSKHGGQIEVESELGIGSVFSFTLPKVKPQV